MYVCISSYCYHRALHVLTPSLPTRRSSDLALVGLVDDDGVVGRQPAVRGDLCQQDAVGHELDRGVGRDVVGEAYLEAHRTAERHLRSEEHTSELQSLMRNSYAVYCLKKTQKTNT